MVSANGAVMILEALLSICREAGGHRICTWSMVGLFFLSYTSKVALCLAGSVTGDLIMTGGGAWDGRSPNI